MIIERIIFFICYYVRRRGPPILDVRGAIITTGS